jgi:adenine-specific DNA-methyltransferase
VIRFWNNDVLTNIDGVLEVILEALQKKEEDPHPNPLPRAGEGAKA